MPSPKTPRLLACFLAGAALATAGALRAAPAVPELDIDASRAVAHVSPTLYGLMTEEINYAYEGGLYAELIRNRSFKADPKEPAHWQLVQASDAAATMALDSRDPLNSAQDVSLKLDITHASAEQRTGIANGGYWGIPVRPDTAYRASFYARAAGGFSGPLQVSLVSDDGRTVFAQAEMPQPGATWQKYEVTLTTGSGFAPSKTNRLLITAGHPGTVWFSLVSLFPPTWNHRPNGLRIDIMKLLAAMKPAFLRFPGGNYLEGDTIATRFNWKETIGDIAQRPGHKDDGWGYWSTDGMGLLEFLEWCEDLRMEPVLAVYAGYSLHQQHVPPGPELQPYVQDALDEIQYLTGGAGTTWGAQRVRDGHPAPFALRYVEIGNEDEFDHSHSYDGRFTQFYDAIKAAYPELQVIATARVTSRTPDVIDEHYYRSSMLEMASHAHDYDARPRTGPKVFVGEWATRVGSNTPDLAGALGDAAWLTGLERNSDLVIMSSYAPLFVNVNPGAMQWRTDLIGYDALTSYGSPAYYVQKMFNRHHGDTVLAAAARDIPTQEWQPPRRRGQAEAPAARPVPTLFFDATRDTQTGAIFLKLVNLAGAPQPVRVKIAGADIAADGRALVLSGASMNDTNSITEPKQIVPVAAPATGLGTDFTRTLPAYSVTVLELRAPPSNAAVAP